MEFYRPWAQENFPFLSITVRSNLSVDAVTKLVQIRARDTSIPVWRSRCRNR